MEASAAFYRAFDVCWQSATAAATEGRGGWSAPWRSPARAETKTKMATSSSVLSSEGVRWSVMGCGCWLVLGCYWALQLGCCGR
jgi:hypothetical protein